MPIDDMPKYLETRRKFLANRAVFPVEELEKHAGKWVAFSPDGSRIVASARHPEQLETLVKVAGEDPLECVIEGMPDDGPWLDVTDGSAA
jgi:hypothetical protein